VYAKYQKSLRDAGLEVWLRREGIFSFTRNCASDAKRRACLTLLQFKSRKPWGRWAGGSFVLLRLSAGASWSCGFPGFVMLNMLAVVAQQ